MSRPIEDYGFIGNMLSGALVSRDGSIDWLCLPRFDSGACFAALLGTTEHGYWRIAPAAGEWRATRRYLPGSPIIETTFEGADGRATVTDFMPLSDDRETVDVVRVVTGVAGRLAMRMELALRFGYGRNVPWVRRRDYGISAIAGPDAAELVTPVALHGEGFRTVAEFACEPGQHVPFTFAYHPQHRAPRFVADARERLAATQKWWQDWLAARATDGSGRPPWDDAVVRSLVTLKALTYAPSGAIVAAPTTSLPEAIGGTRNWDYRYCWLRDATLTLYALANCGSFAEAGAFRDWLLRAAAGAPEQLQIMYGIDGERRLEESELPWLPGYAGSKPVRIGNAAASQLQLDVFGELMDALHMARKSKLGPDDEAWRFQRVLLRHLEGLWQQPDCGMWETRGPPAHFTYSKVMTWVAFDRAIKAVEQAGVDGPVERWRAIRSTIRATIERDGYDASRNTFVQRFGSPALDASLLLLAETGFVTADDPRFAGTVAAVERELLDDGFVRRYRPAQSDDGIGGEEGSFLACSFWLASAYSLIGRERDAERLFERLLGLRNDLGLLAEEYDPRLRRQVGNFPQAFSHVALISTAYNLGRANGPAHQRADRSGMPQAKSAAY